MKLFISYPRKAAADIDRIRLQFPDRIRAMLDTNVLQIGENWAKAVESLVTEVDYVLLYVTEDAVSSAAMEEELQWITRREKDTGRNMLLPVVTDSNLLHDGYLRQLRDRNYILFNKRGIGGEIQIRTDDDYKAIVMEILAKLSILLIEEREQNILGVMGSTRVSFDDIKMAQAIADVVSGTNRRSPRRFEDVIRILSNPRVKTAHDVHAVIRHLTENKLLGGVHYVMDGIYEGFDHFKLKALQSVDNKKRIAARAADQIDSRDIVILDSGSTCNELAQALVSHISDGMLTGLDVIVCSASAAKPFLDYCDTRLHDADPIFKLHIRGGNVRLRNHAIVAGNSLVAYTDIATISGTARTGRRVKSFIGCNYFDENGVFYSVETDEADNKKQIMIPSDEVFILADAGKWLNESDKTGRFPFADAAFGKNITAIIGGYFPHDRQQRLKATGVKVLTTGDLPPSCDEKRNSSVGASPTSQIANASPAKA